MSYNVLAMSTNHELAVKAPLIRSPKPDTWVPWGRSQGGRICAVAACKRVTALSGWCRRHYGFWLTYGTPDPHKAPDLEGEEWRPAPGWESAYNVSSQGRIKNASTGRILRLRYTKGRRYAAIHLPLNGKSVDRYLHVLVAEAFLGPKPTGLDVNHKDGDRLNNAATNLEYVTRQENIRHAVRLGLR